MTKQKHRSKNRIVIKKLAVIALVFLSAGCNFFATALPAGVAKSVNGGVDWQYKNTIPDVENGSMVGLSISKLDFDPNNREIVFASSYTDGLFKSEDSGENWKKILSTISVYDFAINPQDTKIIYAAGYYADHGRLLKTVDGGASWTQIYNEESQINAVRSMALNPENPNQLVIGTTSGSIIKSSDAGATWQLVKNMEDRINRVLWQKGNIYVLARTKGLFKASGASSDFSDISTALGKVYTGSDFTYTTLSPIETFNQVFVDFTTSGLIYITTDRGVFKTVDDGKNWQALSLPVKPDEAIARAVSISRTSSNIVYISVGSTIYKSLDGGSSWQTQSLLSAGFVNYILIDPQLPQIVYSGIFSDQ